MRAVALRRRVGTAASVGPEIESFDGAPMRARSRMWASADDGLPSWQSGSRFPVERHRMPTVLRAGPYRLFFFAGDRDEPPHVHVERETRRAKVWLDLVRLEESGGFGRVGSDRVVSLVATYQELLLRSWHDYFTG